jgi:prepilin-type N-terminal cleavage/methylation domain-containing protein
MILMHSPRAKFSCSAFTLIELLVVIAIIAILAVVVILTLNPAQLLAQSRDANRVSDVATLSSALNLYVTDQAGTSGFSLGNASNTAISVFDPQASSTCGNLGLPSLNTSTGQAWLCSTSSTYRNINNAGWIPVNLSSISAGSPIGNLPVDPTNQTSSGLFYAYNANGSQFEVTANLESQKYKAQYGTTLQTSFFPEVISGGTQGVSALYNPTGLVGYWPLDEGSGTIALDQSGNGNNGKLTCSGTSCSYPSWVAGKVGGSALYGNPSSSQSSYFYTSPINNPAVSGSALSVALWINPNSTQTGSGGAWFMRNGSGNDENYGFDLTDSSGGYYRLQMSSYTGGIFVYSGSTNYIIPAHTWSYLVLIFTQGQSLQVYLNGVFQQTISYAHTSVVSGSNLTIGGGFPGTPQNFSGSLDDIRIYNRALSMAEIGALYNAEK